MPTRKVKGPKREEITRMTVKLPVEVFRRAKMKAAERGTSLQKLVADALENEVRK